MRAGGGVVDDAVQRVVLAVEGRMMSVGKSTYPPTVIMGGFKVIVFCLLACEIVLLRLLSASSIQFPPISVVFSVFLILMKQIYRLLLGYSEHVLHSYV